MSERIRRLRACVEVWPECHEGGYHPSCCRFPKSCSCDIYDPELVSEADLEPEDYPDADGLAALRTEAERKFRDMQERGESYWHRAEAAEAELADARERLRQAEERLAAVDALVSVHIAEQQCILSKMHWEGAERICDTHGSWWPDKRDYCNRVRTLDWELARLFPQEGIS